MALPLFVVLAFGSGDGDPARRERKRRRMEERIRRTARSTLFWSALFVLVLWLLLLFL